MALTGRFQLIIPPDLLAPEDWGVWGITVAQSFGASVNPADILVWRVSLPDGFEAGEVLEQQTARLRAGQDDLLQAGRRLDQATRQLASGRSFAPELPRPERDLIAWTRMVQGESSFSWWEDHWLDWRQLLEQAEDFLRWVRRSLAYYAWVETYFESQPGVGRTIVSWLGDLRTDWPAGLAASHVGLHRQAVALALHTRTMWLRLILQAGFGAAKIASLLATPGGVILAFPEALRFLRQVLQDMRTRPS